MKNISRNAVALIVTVVAHMVVLIGLTRVRLNPPSMAPEYHTTWIIIGTDKPIIERSRKKLMQPSGASLQIEGETTALTAPIAISSTDWRKQGEQVAGKIAARGVDDDERRLLSTPNKMEQQPIPKDTVALFPAPLRNNGDSQRVGGGEIITWNGDECYATNRPFEAPQLDGNALHVVCKDPFKGRTDLFDHLKPKYLQAAPGKDIDQPAQSASDETVAPTCSYSTFRCK